MELNGTCLIIELNKAFLRMFRFLIQIDGIVYLAISDNETAVGEGYITCTQLILRLYTREDFAYLGNLTIYDVAGSQISSAKFEIAESRLVLYSLMGETIITGERIRTAHFFSLINLNKEMQYSFQLKSD